MPASAVGICTIYSIDLFGNPTFASASEAMSYAIPGISGVRVIPDASNLAAGKFNLEYRRKIKSISNRSRFIA